jgi:hypothetical protein
MTAIIGNTASRLQLAQLFFGVSGSAASSTASASGTNPVATGVSSSVGPAVRVTLLSQARPVALLQTPSNSLGLALPDDLAKSLAKDQKAAADLIATLDQVKKSMTSDRKAAAMEKLDRARRKLELLRMFGGDPKAVAREAKRIAEEIRAAAREYAAALKSEGRGDASAADSAAVDASASTTAAPPDPGAAQAAGAAAAGEAAAKPADGLAKGDAPPVGETAAAATNQPHNLVDQDPANQEPVKETDRDAARQKTVQAYQDAAARVDAKAGKERVEQETLAKFKDAAREAKRLIEDAARKLKAKNPSDPDARDAERAKAAMDEQIQELSDTMHAQQDGSTADVSVGALAGVGTAAAAPVLDILT